MFFLFPYSDRRPPTRDPRAPDTTIGEVLRVVSVPSVVVGLIVGGKGSNLDRLRRLYGNTQTRIADRDEPSTLGCNRRRRIAFTGAPEAIDADGLVQMLGCAELVVLNGCKTLALAEALARAGVPNVVCCETLLCDAAGRLFAEGFWRRVAAESQAGASLQEAARLAFEAGELAVRSATVAGGALALDNGRSAAASTPEFALGIDPEDAALVALQVLGGVIMFVAYGDMEEGPLFGLFWLGFIFGFAGMTSVAYRSFYTEPFRTAYVAASEARLQSGPSPWDRGRLE